jgi:hypothetical protein
MKRSLRTLFNVRSEKKSKSLSSSHLLDHIDLGAIVQQELDDVDMAIATGKMQRGPATLSATNNTFKREVVL